MVSRLNRNAARKAARNLALAVGLACVTIVLLLVCAAGSAPPSAAAPAHDDLWPLWTSTEPVTTMVGSSLYVWNIEPYSMTVTFYRGAVSAPAVFTFTPKMDLKLDPPLISTVYMFEIKGTYVNDHDREVSLVKPIDYELLYEESRLGEVSEDSLGLYYLFDGKWRPWEEIDVNTGADRITWETPWLSQFGFGGSGPRTNTYLPAVFGSLSRPFTETKELPTD